MEIVATSLPLRGRLFPNVTANGLRSAMSDLCENIGLTHCTPLLKALVSGRIGSQTAAAVMHR
jgi:hypothetical protein